MRTGLSSSRISAPLVVQGGTNGSNATLATPPKEGHRKTVACAKDELDEFVLDDDDLEGTGEGAAAPRKR